MSLIINGKDAKVHWLNKIPLVDGKLTADHGILYVSPKGLGQVTKNNVAGMTPAEAFESRYAGMKSALLEDFVAEDIIVFDKIHGVNHAYDDSVRMLINQLNGLTPPRVAFTANVNSTQQLNSNSEALFGYNRENHLADLIKVVKQYFGINTYFDTRDPITWRWKQADDISDIYDCLKAHNLCLYAAYTSRGKTKISVEVATRLCQQGGIVLVTTPITDTKQSFKDNINDFHFGADRTLKITYLDSKEFARHSVQDLTTRANNRELIFIVLTVQDARYKDSATDDVEALRDKYDSLSGNVDLWIRDERHFQYSGEVTSKRLANMKADYELDLTATPYSVLDQYRLEHIVSRTLIWGLKHSKHTKLPVIRIESFATPFSAINTNTKSLFSTEEGFDPRKLFARIDGNFVLENELLFLSAKFYYDKLSKTKNPLTIANDHELSPVAKKCGLWVLPAGQDGDSAGDYIPALADLLNKSAQDTFYIDSYTVESKCPKDITIGDYIQSLITTHNRVVILTCGKFLTGTDIPSLGHIVLFDKMENIANFEQLLGRMIREYPGKDKVKLYSLTPGNDLHVVLGRMAKANELLSGTPAIEMLECVPLSEYSLDGTQINHSPESILASVQAWFAEKVKDRLPGASLSSALEHADLSLWSQVKLKELSKKSSPVTNLTPKNGAKVKTKTAKINPTTGKPYTDKELQEIELIETIIQSVMVEAQWVAYSTDCYDYRRVLRDTAIVQMFGQAVVDAVLDLANQSTEVDAMLSKHMMDRQLAYKNLDFEEVHPEIFRDSKFKQSIGLVYDTIELAKFTVATLNKNKYNNKTIVVGCAAGGALPYIIRKTFDNVTVICAEWEEQPYFADHLRRLGFTTVIGYKELKKLKKEKDIVFHRGFQNPPYLKGLWKKFTTEMYDIIAEDGEMVSINPNPLNSYGERADEWRTKCRDMHLQSVQDATGFFPNVNSGALGLFHFDKKKPVNEAVFERTGTAHEILASCLNNNETNPQIRTGTRGNFEFLQPKVKGVKRNKNNPDDQLPRSDTPTTQFSQQVVLSVTKDALVVKYFEPKPAKKLDANSPKASSRVFVTNRSFGRSMEDPVYLIEDAEDCEYTNNVLIYTAEEGETVESFKSYFLSKTIRAAIDEIKGGGMDVQAGHILALRCPPLTQVYTEEEIQEYLGITDPAHIEYIKNFAQ